MSDLVLHSLLQATWETVYMVFIASFLSIFLGLACACILFITTKKQSLANSSLHRLLGFIINITRSTPFIILMIGIVPLTRMIMGTTIGTNAAIVPLTIAAISFYARVAESALTEVPSGLLETAQAMGASTWQIITKILLPESLPALIRGATLTVIGIIGYSAMAGVVGGGGLGELAINYGYERFNIIVMLETVLILIIMVQLIQLSGDFLAKRRRLKPVIVVSILLWFSCFIYQFWPTTLYQQNIIRVGIMSGWQQEVMQVAAQVAQKNYGIHLQIVTFTDYVQPNAALSNNSIDANIFQHKPYLDAQIQAHHFQLVQMAKTFVYPMGFYSRSIKQISQLPDGGLVAISNDPSNGGRALLLLQKAGLIKLKNNAGTLASVQDIIENNHHLRFILLDAAQLPRSLHDADLVAINNDFISAAKLSIQDAIIKEASDSPYANLIVVRAQDKNKPLLQKLVAIMHSKAVQAETAKIFPHGAAIPAW